MMLDDALAVLTTTYQDMALMARGMDIDPAEIASALLTAEADSAEGVALRMLAQMYPVPPAPVATVGE